MMTFTQLLVFFYGGIAFFALGIAVRLRADFSELSPKMRESAARTVGLTVVCGSASWAVAILDVLAAGYVFLKGHFG